MSIARRTKPANRGHRCHDGNDDDPDNERDTGNDVHLWILKAAMRSNHRPKARPYHGPGSVGYIASSLITWTHDAVKRFRGSRQRCRLDRQRRSPNNARNPGGREPWERGRLARRAWEN